MTRYIWQLPAWPNLIRDDSALLRPLGKTRQAQGELFARADYFELNLQADVLTEEAFTTAAIEGESLNRQAVRSSVARRLGLPTAGLPASDRHIDGLVEMLIDATRNYATPLTASRLKGWQASLFPTGYAGLHRIVTGDWRRDKTPMQVISGPVGKEKIHFEAPPAANVPAEIKQFLAWFKSSPDRLDGLVRAAEAHLRFVTIHPFADGNGRVARAITDMALAQDEKKGFRLYSMSAQINAEREQYYNVLERTQKGKGDITEWIIWFLECLQRAMEQSALEINKVMDKARFWRNVADHNLNDRQKKAVNKLLDAGPGGFEGGLTNKKYRAMTRTTRETAKRDLIQLVGMGILKKNPGGGRSVSYDLFWSE
ncbi:MAG: Fic family protein [Thermodesulfobacteriota bacterium]